MKDYVELLCYSEKQLALLRQHGGDAGVVLIDGGTRPVLTTETVSNLRLIGFFSSRAPRECDPLSLKSNWDDAIVVHTSDGDGYDRLVNGAGKVTDARKAWCAATGVDPTAEAVRAAADVPRHTMKQLKLCR